MQWCPGCNLFPKALGLISRIPTTLDARDTLTTHWMDLTLAFSQQKEDQQVLTVLKSTLP